MKPSFAHEKKIMPMPEDHLQALQVARNPKALKEMICYPPVLIPQVH
jgi:hypothetical protein